MGRYIDTITDMDEESKKILENHEDRIKKLEALIQVDKVAALEPIKENIWDIEGNDLTITRIIGEKNEEKTQNTALLALLGYKEKFNQDKVLASELRRNVAINKIPIENFGTYINQLIPQSILRVGKIKSNKLAYKLTAFGYARAREILSKILEK